MIREFEGKSEHDAIQKAANELGLAANEFDVEILETETKKGLFFKKGSVKIRVHVADNAGIYSENFSMAKSSSLEPESEAEKKVTAFLEKTIELMGFPGTANVVSREDGKIAFNIESDHVSILIGKKGKNLDALQLLANVYLSSIDPSSETKATIDAEDYRRRREESLVRLALKNAENVVKSKSSRLLEPMNPFERRLIHTALNDRNDVITQSEGEGLYKQVRIIYKGSR